MKYLTVALMGVLMLPALAYAQTPKSTLSPATEAQYIQLTNSLLAQIQELKLQIAELQRGTSIARNPANTSKSCTKAKDKRADVQDDIRANEKKYTRIIAEIQKNKSGAMASGVEGQIRDAKKEQSAELKKLAGRDSTALKAYYAACGSSAAQIAPAYTPPAPINTYCTKRVGYGNTATTCEAY